MRIFNELTVKTKKGAELTYFISEGMLKVKTPAGVAVVVDVLAPHRDDRVVIKLDENGVEKTASATYEDAQLIKALFCTVLKGGRELYAFDSLESLSDSSEFGKFGSPFQITGSDDFFAYKYS